MSIISRSLVSFQWVERLAQEWLEWTYWLLTPLPFFCLLEHCHETLQKDYEQEFLNLKGI